MANRKRNIQMKFYVTEEEKRLIDEKMAQLPTRRYGAYLRKMAIDYICNPEKTDEFIVSGTIVFFLVFWQNRKWCQCHNIHCSYLSLCKHNMTYYFPIFLSYKR